MIKIGVIGAGHLGKIHLKLLNSSTKFSFITLPSNWRDKKSKNYYNWKRLYEN